MCFPLIHSYFVTRVTLVPCDTLPNHFSYGVAFKFYWLGLCSSFWLLDNPLLSFFSIPFCYEHLRILQPTFFPNKWQGPSENIHEVWKPVWMRRTVELPDIHNIVLILQYCSWEQQKEGCWIHKHIFLHLHMTLVDQENSIIWLRFPTSRQIA